jgi:hypothetical protein
MAHDLVFGKTKHRWARSTMGDEPLVWTRSAVRGELDRIRNLLDLTNREMTQAVKDKKVTGEEWQGWRDTYVAGHKFLDEASVNWGSNVAPARQHAAEAERWRDLLKSRGASLVGPVDAGKRKDEPLTTTQLALLGVGGVAAAALLITSIRK